MRTLEKTRTPTRTSARRTNARPPSPVIVVSPVAVYSGPTPYDALEARIVKAMDAARVRRLPDGTYAASTPCFEPLYSTGATRKQALAELWEDCRWLLADPVRITFVAAGRTYTAEVLADRYGGYSVNVPEIPGCCTCGDTMDEVRHNVVEAAEGLLECLSERK